MGDKPVITSKLTSMGDHIRLPIRAPTTTLTHWLRRSGSTAWTLRLPPPDNDHQVIWLPKASTLADARDKATKDPTARGLVFNTTGTGIRFALADMGKARLHYQGPDRGIAEPNAAGPGLYPFRPPGPPARSSKRTSTSLPFMAARSPGSGRAIALPSRTSS